MPTRRCLLLLALLAWPGVARAGSHLQDALIQFEAGEYAAVVNILRPALDAGEPRDPLERAQALRIYGIASTLTGRRMAGETAFLHWLSLEPRARLDPSLVRPEVVDFFNEVRARHREELVREVQRRRPRTAALNLLPPAGQYQNDQRVKFGLLLAAEIALLGTNLGTGIPLYLQRDDHGVFADPEQARRLQIANWASFGALAAVLVYGIIDGFAYYYRINRELQLDEDSLRAEDEGRRLAGPAWLPRF